MKLSKINDELRNKIRNDIPNLEKILENTGDLIDFPDWEKLFISPLEKKIYDNNKLLDKLLNDNSYTREKVDLINSFNHMILNSLSCYYLGHQDKYGLTLFSDNVSIYDQIYEISYDDKLSIKYHMPEFGRPRYNIILSDLNAIYCESFDLINVIYIKKNSINLSKLKKYVEKNKLYIF